MLGTMEVLDGSGHLTLSWDSDKPEEIAAARAEFERLKAVGYAFFADAESYRIWPRAGLTVRLERHGRYEYDVARYCYHDDAQELPEADVALAHYLLIATDEPAFLTAANEHRRPMQQWDGAWKKRLRAAQRRRAQETLVEAVA